MARDSDNPKVPDGPSVVGAEELLVGSDQEPATNNQQPTAPAAANNAKQVAGGRRKYEEILRENEILAKSVKGLRAALAVFAKIPYESSKPAETVVYSLTRNGRTVQIKTGDITAAREALDMEVD
jgi:hypothetical protein